MRYAEREREGDGDIYRVCTDKKEITAVPGSREREREVVMQTEGKTTVFRTIIQPYTRARTRRRALCSVVQYYIKARVLSRLAGPFFTASTATKTKKKKIINTHTHICINKIKQLQNAAKDVRTSADRRRGPTRPEFTESDDKKRRTEKQALSYGVHQLFSST